MTCNILKTYQEISTQAEFANVTPYLVLDGAWQEVLISKIRQSDEGWEPLMGTPNEKKHEVHKRSPILVNLTVHDYALTEWIKGDFKEKIGIIVFTKQDIATLRRTLKRFLQMLTPESASPVYFRFFDARTLYCFLRLGFQEQWKDFFRDISLIAAPYDYSAGWAVYQYNDPALKIRTEQHDRDGWTWHTYENKDRQVEQYNITFPFRTIGQRQYNDMMHCTQQLFYHEIRDKMQAISKELQEPPDAPPLKQIERLAEQSKQFHCVDEDAVMYFCVMGYLFGPKFYEEELFVEHIKNRYRLPEELLAEIIDEYAIMTGSQTLKKLARPWVQ